MAGKNRCEGEVDALDRTVQHTKTFAQRAGAAYVAPTCFQSWIGAAVTIWGLESTAWPVTVIGLIFAIGGMVHAASGRRHVSGQ